MSERPPVPRWLGAAFLVLLVLPFDPYWIDFEQVRRGLLLVGAGLVLVVCRPLPAVRGDGWLRLFVLGLCASAAFAWLGELGGDAASATPVFQPFEALYRIAHWLALLVVLRLGAAANGNATPFVAVLAITSAFGLLQRLGLGEIAGYGVEREPVSLFGNLNVASEWTAVAAMVVAVALPGITSRAMRCLALVALVFAGAYLVVNQSRSGLIALPLGLGALAACRRRERPWPPLFAVAGGAALGLMLASALVKPAPPDAAAELAERQRATSTLEVRREIALGSFGLWLESPLFGYGPGQFAVVYPSVRSQREIAMSSLDRQFPTEVRTAHDDWLELLVDGGVLALLLFGAVLVALLRRQPEGTRRLPLLVLLLLMLARAPLWNAPAAVAALWLTGTPTPPQPPRRWTRPFALACGLALVALGMPLFLGNHCAARYQAAVARAQSPDPGQLAAAAWWMPFEPRWLELQTREQIAAGHLPEAATLAARAIRLRPNHPQLYLNLGEVLAQGAKFAEAKQVAATGLAIDPGHPELHVLLSTALAQLGDVDGAIVAIADWPHRRVRERLERHFFDLSQVAMQRGDGRAAARFLLERHVVAAIDGLGATSPAGLAATNEHVRQSLLAARTAGSNDDARPWLLSALQLLDADQPDQKLLDQLRERVTQCSPLLPWQRELFGAALDRLQTLDGFREFLARH